MSGKIHLNDALQAMEQRDEHGNAVPFSIEWVTYSRKDDTGGDIIRMDSAVKVMGKRKGKAIATAGASNAALFGKNPQHVKNQTRNVMHTVSKQMRKLHIRLITKFNDQIVYY